MGNHDWPYWDRIAGRHVLLCIYPNSPSTCEHRDWAPVGFAVEECPWCGERRLDSRILTPANA